MTIMHLLKIEILPVLTDNYTFILINLQTNNCIIVDPSVAKEILDFCNKRNLTIKYILNTHHHHDHIGGNCEIKKHTDCKIIAPIYDKHRINDVDIFAKENDHFEIEGINIKIIFIPGHTSGHIAFYLPYYGVLFCGDTIFSGGCGRIFEGTYEQMFHSISLIKNLPKKTLIYCAHEYTISNLKFALSIFPKDKKIAKYLDECIIKRQSSIPTIPTTLSRELKINPFLRCKTIEEFKHLRLLKNTFC